MSFRMSDYNYNYSIQKVARDVIAGMRQGKNPLDLLIKAATAEKMTPQLIESSVQYLNNELMLQHFENKSTDPFQFINVSDVLQNLSIKDTEKTASAQVVKQTDYWDLRTPKSSSFEKVASIMEPDVAFENRKKSFEKIASFEAIAKTKYEETKNYDSMIKKASELKKLKDTIYNETFMMLKKGDIDPEEIRVLSDISEDEDMKDIYDSALKNSKLKVAEDKYKDILKKVATDGPDFESPVLKSMNSFLALKSSI